jgi:hypothetical protein
VAEEAENDGLVGAVAFPGGSQGAVEVAAQTGDRKIGDLARKTGSGPHGPDRVRGGRPDSDRKEVEDGEVQGTGI